MPGPALPACLLRLLIYAKPLHAPCLCGHVRQRQHSASLIGRGQLFPAPFRCNGSCAQAKAIVSTLLPREGLDKLPLYGMGASSGGAFVLVAAMGSVKFAGEMSY